MTYTYLWVANLNYRTPVPKWESVCVDVSIKTQLNNRFINASCYKFASLKKVEVEKFCETENLKIETELQHNKEHLLLLYKQKINISGENNDKCRRKKKNSDTNL